MPGPENVLSCSMELTLLSGSVLGPDSQRQKSNFCYQRCAVLIGSITRSERRSTSCGAATPATLTSRKGVWCFHSTIERALCMFYNCSVVLLVINKRMQKNFTTDCCCFLKISLPVKENLWIWHVFMSVRSHWHKNMPGCSLPLINIHRSSQVDCSVIARTDSWLKILIVIIALVHCFYPWLVAN